VLERSVPNILFLLRGPKVDEGEKLDITIVVHLVGAQVVTVMLGGPPAGREAIDDGSIDEVHVSHDVISLMVTLMTDPATKESTDTQAEDSQERVGMAIIGCEEAEGESVKDLDSFDDIICLEESFFLELLTDLDVIRWCDLILVGELGGLHVLEHLASSVGVDGVEVVSGVAIVEFFDDQSASRMELGEFGDVVQSVVNDDVGFLVLGSLGIRHEEIV